MTIVTLLRTLLTHRRDKMRRNPLKRGATRYFFPAVENLEDRLAPAVGGITELALPAAANGAYGVAAGPDGNLWVAESAADQIARITPGGAVTEFAIPTANSTPYYVTGGP